MPNGRLPEKFGPYAVLEQIGSGGMGAVYRALDPRLRREVAVKVLHRNLEVSRARERFLREARAVSSLNHPNICTVFDIGEQDGDPYLVMELLRGESLKERIARCPLVEAEIYEIAVAVALALQAAHTQGVVHRDIKPANIFLVESGFRARSVKVLDFGLAKLEGEAGPERLETRGLTRAGATLGTVEYMSPEQACGEELDARTDLFSLGAVLYEMATGELPFPGATSAVIFSQLLHHKPRAFEAGNVRLSAAMQRTIFALLAKERGERVPTAAALLEMLAVTAAAERDLQRRHFLGAEAGQGSASHDRRRQRPMPAVTRPVPVRKTEHGDAEELAAKGDTGASRSYASEVRSAGAAALDPAPANRPRATVEASR